MRSRLVLIAGALAAFAAAPAAGQPADPIGELLERAGPDDAEVSRPQAAEPEIALPAAPQPYAAPPVAASLAYESRIRASFASAQGFQGPLDGGWTLAAPEGDLYAFQLVDRGTGTIEGAWRDVRRPLALEGSGFVDAVDRTGGEVVLRFDGTRTAVLRVGAGGVWTGELAEPGGRRTVSLRRSGP